MSLLKIRISECEVVKPSRICESNRRGICQCAPIAEGHITVFWWLEPSSSVIPAIPAPTIIAQSERGRRRPSAQASNHHHIKWSWHQLKREMDHVALWCRRSLSLDRALNSKLVHPPLPPAPITTRHSYMAHTHTHTHRLLPNRGNSLSSGSTA